MGLIAFVLTQRLTEMAQENQQGTAVQCYSDEGYPLKYMFSSLMTLKEH